MSILYLSILRRANISQYEGLIYCDVLAPDDLRFGVLPSKESKLVFPLCAACADASDTHARCTHTDEERMLRGTWTHLELRKALEKG